MSGCRRAVVGWIVSVAFCVGFVAAPAAAAPITIPDPVGDSTAAADPRNAPLCGPLGCRPPCSAGCPDISAVHVSEAGGRIIVEVDSSAPWEYADASVAVSGESPFGVPVGIRMSRAYPGSQPFERVVDGTRYVYRLDPAAAFMGHLPLAVRVQAKATSADTIGSTPTEYDRAPDASEATYQLDNRDGDGVPDLGDPCPDAAEAEPPEGWEETNGNQFGCPGIVPFAHADFVAEAKKTKRALLALWRDPDRRAAAIRRRRLTLPFRVPAGVVKARVLVYKNVESKRLLRFHLATRLLDCPAGACRLVARVYPRNVRRLAGKRIKFVLVAITEGPSGVHTSYASPVRMRAG